MSAPTWRTLDVRAARDGLRIVRHGPHHITVVACDAPVSRLADIDIGHLSDDDADHVIRSATAGALAGLKELNGEVADQMPMGIPRDMPPRRRRQP